MNNIEKHKHICEKLNELYKRKNHDYGDSFEKSFNEWGMTMPCIRLSDKLNRLINLSKNLTKQAIVSDESVEDTLLDLANYSIMTIMAIREKTIYSKVAKGDKKDNE